MSPAASAPSIQEEPSSVAELRNLILQSPRLVFRGSGSRPCLAPRESSSQVVSLKNLTGVRTYHPLDFTITALAGTPLSLVSEVLAERGQGLAFEPPVSSLEATLGGCVASALEGSAGSRSGGIRESVLAMQFCDGRGQLHRSGARVLQNSAGLDLPRFLTGTLGRFAAITEITLRSHPLPERTATIAWRCDHVRQAVSLLQDLACTPWNFDALDIAAHQPLVLGRIRGREKTVPARARKIAATYPFAGQVLTPEDSDSCWNLRSNFSWAPPEQSLIRVPLAVSSIPEFDDACSNLEALRTYTKAGRLAWVSHSSPALLEGILREQSCQGLLMRDASSQASSPFLGRWSPSPLMQKLKHLFDPDQRFLPWPEAELD